MKLFKFIFKRIEQPIELELPSEPLYYFESRRAYRIIPIFSTWNMERKGEPEYVHALDITVVHTEFDTSIERLSFTASQSTFQEFIDRKTDRITAASTIANVIHKLLYFPKDDLRTKDVFEADLKAAIAKITE